MGKTKIVAISLPEELYMRAEEVRMRIHQPRSTYYRLALEAYLSREGR